MHIHKVHNSFHICYISSRLPPPNVCPVLCCAVLCPTKTLFPSEKELEKEEAGLHRTKDDILQQSQRLTASFLAQKGELEVSTRRAEERVRTAESEVAALKEELDAAR